MAAERIKPHQRGVALIEVMVALLVFLVGVLGVIGLQASSIQHSVQAEDRSRAALLANELVTQLWTLQTPALDEWQRRVASALPNSEGIVSQQGGVVTVTIRWREPSGRASAGNVNQYVTQLVLP